MGLIDEFIASHSVAEMKTTIIQGEEKEYSFGTQKELDDQFLMLRREFIGHTELELYHALLNVLIRRKINLEANVKRFHELWDRDSIFLSSRLDSRWLVSACDTIMDYGETDDDRAIAMAGAVLTNTIKLYETERAATGRYGVREEYAPFSGRVALHDGMSAYLIGHGDMVFNLHERIDRVCHKMRPAAIIMRELIFRANHRDTVFNRFGSAQVNEATKWSIFRPAKDYR